MSTSAGGLFNAFAYVGVLAAVLATTRVTVGEPHTRDPVVVALWLAVAVPSVIGLALGPVYDALSRQPHLIKERGELWRLLTAAVVQDGGVAGAAFQPRRTCAGRRR